MKLIYHPGSRGYEREMDGKLMGVRGTGRVRTSSNYTEVEGVLFYNTDHSQGSGNWPPSVLITDVRSAAKRFVSKPEFDPIVIYYNCFRLDGKWQFEPHGRKSTDD